MAKIELDDGWFTIPKNYLVHGSASREHAMAMLGAGDHGELMIEKEIGKIRLTRNLVDKEARTAVKTEMKNTAVAKHCRVKNFLHKTVEPIPVKHFDDLKRM